MEELLQQRKQLEELYSSIEASEQLISNKVFAAARTKSFLKLIQSCVDVVNQQIGESFNEAEKEDIGFFDLIVKEVQD